MIVLIETNFILEIAFLRNQTTSCNTLLNLAESGDIDLVLPVFSVAESFHALEGRRKNRVALQSNLDKEIQEILRSSGYEDLLAEPKKLTGLLVKIAEEEKKRLEDG